MKAYQAPKQLRALESENRFLNAFDEILTQKSFGKTTIEHIASHAGLQKGAFLKRFGSKHGALIALFERYCAAALGAISDSHLRISQHTLLHDLCFELSETLEKLQRSHFSANRAMQEYFMEELEVSPQTKGIFKALVGLMQRIQSHYLADQPCSRAGAYAAAQLMVTLNYNYVLQAMPAFPADHKARHDLIANLVIRALWT